MVAVGNPSTLMADQRQRALDRGAAVGWLVFATIVLVVNVVPGDTADPVTIVAVVTCMGLAAFLWLRSRREA